MLCMTALTRWRNWVSPVRRSGFRTFWPVRSRRSRPVPVRPSWPGWYGHRPNRSCRPYPPPAGPEARGVASQDPPRRRNFDPATWLNRLVARANVQRIAARLPGGAILARRDGADIFDLVQGFVRSGVLSALIELRILHR